jgi:hypothetical protein
VAVVAIKILVRGEDSEGRVGIVESVMPAGAAGPPLHVHDFDDTSAGFEREFARRAARSAGTEPPAWAIQPVPEVRYVGPRIGETDAQTRAIQRDDRKEPHVQDVPRRDSA